MQTISLQFDILSGAGTTFDAGNVEGAQWPKLGEDQKVETGTPQTVPEKEENQPVSPFGIAPDTSAEQTPLVGTIVPLHNPPFLKSIWVLLFSSCSGKEDSQWI